MLKKCIASLLCFIFVSSAMTSCGNSNTDVKDSIGKIESTEFEKQKISTMLEAENSQNTDGLSTALRQMSFHDYPLSFPCQFSALCEQFSLGNGFYFEEGDYTYYDLIYCGENVASIGIEGEKSNNNNHKEVVMMIIEDEQLSTLIINGKTCDMNMDNMKECLGTPDKESVDDWKSMMEYNTDDMDLTIVFNDDRAHEMTFVKKGE